MDRFSIAHNLPTEEPPPPPFGGRQEREKECCGCGRFWRGTGLWCPTCRADVVPVEPRDYHDRRVNAQWAGEVARRLDLIAPPLTPVAPDYADWACLRCGDDCEDPAECWCVGCQRELAKGA